MSNAEIVVVGAGVAGLSAALAVADAGQDVTLSLIHISEPTRPY